MLYEIKPPKGLIQINLSELWRYRDLLYIFVWRDIKVRYKQTAVGVAWGVFQPFLTMVIFSLFFGKLAQVPSEGVPYPVFVYTGLLLWNYFAAALTGSSDSLVANEGIVKKVYFPRLILPISSTVTPAIDFAISFLVLIALMFYYGFTPTLIGILVMPVLLLVSLIGAAGLGFLLSSANVKYRDVRFILPFFIQIMLFLTPVIYPVSIIPQKFQWIAYLNPMAGLITLARGLLLHTGTVDWRLLPISLLSALVLFVIGLVYFRKTERFFADIL